MIDFNNFFWAISFANKHTDIEIQYSFIKIITYCSITIEFLTILLSRLKEINKIEFGNENEFECNETFFLLST